MGYLHYGPSQIFRFDDRALAHLRTVIMTKLLQQESLLFTWNDAGIQRSIWLQPSVPLQFEFEAAETPAINRAWLEELTAVANAPAGLRLLPEPDPGQQH
ncbi:hypothetical protein [Leucobacter sp. wl10]|uniref:DUF7882 family protein n=1 Tax=Leucobacter sp. wl10 TaxID=2304677 RepID=UPI000E5A9835|nr:hypothetical protein [Leucobacter sp. wl10]RGE23254.1 hypothetical protein D1J51_03205 [Leucobacter sp. wl10]